SGIDTNCWWKTPIDQLNSRELHELYSRFSELLNLFHVVRYKKIATASSMHASTNLTKDVLTIGRDPNNFEQLKLWSVPRIYEPTSRQGRVDVVTRRPQRLDEKIGHVPMTRRTTSQEGACDVAMCSPIQPDFLLLVKSYYCFPN
ncbi:hypothetical protein Goshw_014244, partial [Gossypium schwendimanii]|nr:hypothetical protein [Gossypium schwendimanii]